MTEQLLLIEPDITVLRPVFVEGYRRGRVGAYGGMVKSCYWTCACGKTLHQNQVIKHLRAYHFYTFSDARAVFRQAKLGKPQHLPRLVNILKEG